MSGIESVLRETRQFEPSAEFSARANVSGRDARDKLAAEAEADWEGFWGRRARSLIEWTTPFAKVFDGANAPFFKWFPDGELNASANCLDRHLTERGDKTAIIFESDEGESRRISYRELHGQVCRFANALKSLGANRGDRIVIYMPMRFEAVAAMQACARIGAIHSVVFGGFSAKSLEDRINDAQASFVITADESRRGGKSIPLKKTVDEALAAGCDSVKNVIVLRRTGADVSMTKGRDVWWHEAVDGQPPECPPEK